MRGTNKPLIVGKNYKPVGTVPSIVLTNPRFAYNVGMVVRLASCYGVQQVWWTGDRVTYDIQNKKKLPREERMKGYKDVQMIQFDRPLEQFENAVPVAVELRPNSERLQDFIHPENAVYVFGPEDGSISNEVLSQCHRFLIIPVKHCLNLATAVATVMWDRASKLNTGLAEPTDFKVSSETKPEEIGLYNSV
jgi:tRNA(Leu) C34 or U34 (ribose-2'-O)-methylase TrmL